MTYMCTRTESVC